MIKEEKNARAILFTLFILVFLSGLIITILTEKFSGLARLLISFILMFLVYMGLKWAKWFIVILFLFTGAYGLFSTIQFINAKNMSGALLMIGFSILYGGTGLYLILGKHINHYLEEKRKRIE
ncbi:MAG: hypothetical protein MUO31_15440 [Thermodesulfovibrionales bacterium]|nr:hypothetical protein [Thermodesulfovibrionales bacterium]